MPKGTIDDVGFGKSSLESLLVLEPHYVKIDQKIIMNVGADSRKRRLLKRILSMIRGIQAEAIAEGVESREDLATLKAAGVEYAQGFLWGLPKEG